MALAAGDDLSSPLYWHRWSRLKLFLTNFIGRAAAFFFVIGNVLAIGYRDFAEKMNLFPNIANQINSLITRLDTIYVGSILLFISYLLYIWLCPDLVRNFTKSDLVNYLCTTDDGFLSGRIFESLRGIFNDAYEIVTDSDGFQEVRRPNDIHEVSYGNIVYILNIRLKLVRPKEEMNYFETGNTRISSAVNIYYNIMDNANITTRSIVLIFYILGISLILFPSIYSSVIVISRLGESLISWVNTCL